MSLVSDGLPTESFLHRAPGLPADMGTHGRVAQQIAHRIGEWDPILTNDRIPPIIKTEPGAADGCRDHRFAASHGFKHLDISAR